MGRIIKYFLGLIIHSEVKIEYYKGVYLLTPQS